MATPIYTTRWAGGRHWGHPAGRPSGVIDRVGSLFGGCTPQYYGSGQPTPATGSSIVGSGTPVYMLAPLPIVTADAVPTAPQANPLAIVVPRS